MAIDVRHAGRSHRGALRDRIGRGAPIMVPQVFDALTARLCAELGFEAGYVGGAALGHSMAVSEALLTSADLAAQTSGIRMRCDLPLLVDIGVGFGDAIHVARTVWTLEHAGASALELEDQVAPKRASHHRGVEHLVPTEEMVGKIRAAVQARRDPDLVLVARTGAVQNESFDRAVERADAYLDAGADVVMLRPQDDQQLAEAPRRISGPVAVLTTFDVQTRQRWQELGYAFVVDGLTGEATAFHALRESYGRQRRGEAGGLAPPEAMRIFEELHVLAGTDQLYDIERQTTEPGT